LLLPGEIVTVRAHAGMRADEEPRVVVVGVCVGTDQITPAMAINKEIDLRFVVGYTPLEFRDTLPRRHTQARVRVHRGGPAASPRGGRRGSVAGCAPDEQR